MSIFQSKDHDKPALTLKKTLLTWLPLAASWLLMSMELPAINAVVARLPNPEVNLAAYGGVVNPIVQIIVAPVIMLLVASTALCRDWGSYQKLKKFTLVMGGVLTGLHLLIAFTPLFDFIVNRLLQAPPEVVEPARIGLIIISPWTLAVAYRRFQQGTMIHFGHAHMVGETTVVRLLVVAVVLMIGIVVKTIPGTILAGIAQGLGVSFEAIYAGLRIRKIYPEIKAAPTAEKNLSLARFNSFYLPLAVTTLLLNFWQPLISGAVSRMPDPLESLAVWSVVNGLLFMFRAPGVAYNEVVVALLEGPQSFHVLRKFARLISVTMAGIGLVFMLSPLSRLWFASIANLPPSLAEIARISLMIGLPLTILSVLISFYQGIIVSLGVTGPVAEAVVVYLLSLGALLISGVVTEAVKGVYVASAAFTFAYLMQCVWLWVRSRKQRLALSLG